MTPPARATDRLDELDIEALEGASLPPDTHDLLGPLPLPPADLAAHIAAFPVAGRRRAERAGTHPPSGEPLQLPVDALDDDPLHSREEYPQAALDALVSDIGERGILQPIVVAPRDAKGRHRILFGIQRWRAARVAGLTTVPVAVRRQPSEDYDHVAENLKRHGLSPLELARFIGSRVAVGDSNRVIAKKLALDPTTVAHHLSLLALPAVLNDAMEAGRCTSPRTLHELLMLHAEQPEAVAQLVAGESPVTRDAVAELRSTVPASTGVARARTAGGTESLSSLIDRLQRLCDRLDRLLARLADGSPDRLRGEPLTALRQRLAALAQRLGVEAVDNEPRVP